MRQQDQITQNLVSFGGKVTESPSRKYTKVVFDHQVMVKIGNSTIGPHGTYWVGRAGALRQGRTVSESTAATDTFRYLVISAHTAPFQVSRISEAKAPESIGEEWRNRYPESFLAAKEVGRDPMADINQLANTALKLGVDREIVRSAALAEMAPWRANEALEKLIRTRTHAMKAGAALN